ncbi:LOW QUALITY PROTEIN: ATP-binding cassette (ABC) Superfamily, partial [Phytophthora palmivora]
MSGSEPESQVPGGNWESSPVDAEWHESWEAFSAHMEEYYKRTHQIFRQRTSTSVAKRNREIAARAARLVANGDEAQAEQLIPEHFRQLLDQAGLYAWSRKSRSKGIRKSYFDRDTGCKANIKAGVTWNDAEKNFMVRVTDSCVTHNHQASKARFDNHASNRRVNDPSVLAFVDELQAAGSKPKLIMQYLRKQTGKKVALRDVHNMVARMRERRRGGVSVEKRLETVMRNFCKPRGNRATVFVDDANTAQTITLQTRQMRRWFKAFPEVLLIDATHNTNESQYKLFSFMVNDVYGH